MIENRFADKMERITFANGMVDLSFSSYDVSANSFRNVLTVKLSLQSLLDLFRMMQEFHGKLIARPETAKTAEVEAVPTPEPEQEVAAKPRPRRAKRRKTAEKEKN